MAIEHACMRVVRKPWGSTDLRPWSEIRQDGVAIGELWFQRPDMNAPELDPAPQVAVHQGTAVDPGSPGRCLRAIDRFGAWQDRGLVHPFRNARRQNCRRAETAAHDPAIAGLDRGRLDFGLGSMTPRPEGRRHFRPGRHDPCDRPGTRGCRDPAAKRRDVPPFRPWSTAGTSRRQRRGGRECGAG